MTLAWYPSSARTVISQELSLIDICVAACLFRGVLASGMSKELFTARPEQIVDSIEELMGAKEVRRLPVIGDAGELMGMISMNDLARVAVGTARKAIDAGDVTATLSRMSSRDRLARWLPNGLADGPLWSNLARGFVDRLTSRRVRAPPSMGQFGGGRQKRAQVVFMADVGAALPRLRAPRGCRLGREHGPRGGMEGKLATVAARRLP
jgi:hypothetical protein